MEIIFDSLSAFQVSSYITQITDNSAPHPGSFTSSILMYYYYRYDVLGQLEYFTIIVVSTALIFVIAVFACFAAVIGQSCVVHQTNKILTSAQVILPSQHCLTVRYHLTLLCCYYRDIVSIAICSYLLMLSCFAVLVLGLCAQAIPYQLLDGEDLDRCAIMNRQSLLRRDIEEEQRLSDLERGEGGDRGDERGDKAARRRQRKELRRQHREEQRAYLLTVDADEINDIQMASGNVKVASL